MIGLQILSSASNANNEDYETYNYLEDYNKNFNNSYLEDYNENYDHSGFNYGDYIGLT